MKQNKTTYYYKVEQWLVTREKLPIYYHEEQFKTADLVESRRAAFKFYFDRLYGVESIRKFLKKQTEGQLPSVINERTGKPISSILDAHNVLQLLFIKCLPGGKEVKYFVMGDDRKSRAKAEQQEIIAFKEIGVDLELENKEILDKYLNRTRRLAERKLGRKIDL